MRSHWPATSTKSQTSLPPLYASGRHGPATSTRTRGISSATSFVDAQSLYLSLVRCDVGAWCGTVRVLSAGYPSFFLRFQVPLVGLSCVMFSSSRDLLSALSSPACSNLMFIFGADSLAAAVKTLPGGTLQRRRHLTALLGLHLNLIQSSAKFPHKTSQHQLRLALRFRSHTNKHQSCPKVIIWHDVIKNSLTPHFSNFNNPLSPAALLQELRALPCDIAAINYCQRTGSPNVFQMLRRSFLVISPVRHLLYHRKQHNLALVRLYSVLHPAIHLELKIYFLLSQHLHKLTSLTPKKSRLNNGRRRSLYRRTLLAQQQQSS